MPPLLSLSPTALGTAYELLTLRFLSLPPLGLQLTRVGGKNDKGVDLRGWFPSSASFARQQQQQQGQGQQRVIVQCKADRRPVGPRIVRELEGSLLFEREAAQGSPVLGVLVARTGFSALAVRRAHASPVPISLLHLEAPSLAPLPSALVRARGRKTPEDGEPRMVSFSMNEATRELLGAQGRAVDVEWARTVGPRSMVQELQELHDEEELVGGHPVLRWATA